MAPTEEWKEMARYLLEQSRQADQLQLTLTASWEANPTGMPLNIVDRTDLDQAEDWVHSRIDDESFDGEDPPSKMIRNMELFKVVQKERDADAVQPGKEDSSGGNQHSGGAQDDSGEDDKHQKRRGGKGSKQTDDDDSEWNISSGDSEDSSDPPSRGPSTQTRLSANNGPKPSVGRGNRSEEAHKAPEYTVAEKEKVILLCGKWYGRTKTPPGFSSKLRRAFNKWLRKQKIMTPGDQSKPLKRHKGGIRQQSKKLWVDGWRVVDGHPVPPPPKTHPANTTAQNKKLAASGEAQQPDVAPGGTSGATYEPTTTDPAVPRPAEAPVARPQPSYVTDPTSRLPPPPPQPSYLTDPTSRLPPPPPYNPTPRPAQAQATNPSAARPPSTAPAAPPSLPSGTHPRAPDMLARLPTPPSVPPPGPEYEEWLAMRRRGEEDLRQRRLTGDVARMRARNRKADHDRRFGFHHPGCGCGRP